MIWRLGLYLFLTIKGAHAASIADHCQLIFGEAHPRAWREGINPEILAEYKERFRENQGRVSTIKARDPHEAKLAALEVLAEKSGAQAPLGLLRDPTSLSAKEFKKLEKQLKKLRFQNISSSAFEKRLGKILKLLHEKDSRLSEYLKLKDPGQAGEDYLLQRTEEALAKDGFKQMAKTLGLPDTLTSKIINKTASLAGTSFRGLLTAASVTSAIQGDFVGIALPHWHSFHPSPKSLGEDLWRRAIENGADSVKEELRAKFKNRANFDLWYNLFAKTINRVVLLALVGVTYQNTMEQIEMQRKLAEEEAKKLEDMQKQTAEMEAFLDQFKTKYDWEDPEKALESMWEDEINAAIESGKKINREAQKYKDARAHFIENGIWEKYVKKISSNEAALSKEEKEKLFLMSQEAYKQKYASKYKITEETWEKRRAEFLNEGELEN